MNISAIMHSNQFGLVYACVLRTSSVSEHSRRRPRCNAAAIVRVIRDRPPTSNQSVGARRIIWWEALYLSCLQHQVADQNRYLASLRAYHRMAIGIWFAIVQLFSYMHRAVQWIREDCCSSCSRTHTNIKSKHIVTHVVLNTCYLIFEGP